MAKRFLSQQIAEFVVGFKQRDMNALVIDRLKVSVMDTVAATFAGAREPSSKLMLEHVVQYYRGKHAGIIGHRLRANPMGAALANATMAHACDFDDASLSMYGHASAAVFPAALAVAEMVNASASQFLAALTVGIETEARIGKLFGKQHFSLGWHSAATLGVIGAAAATSKALKLPYDETLAAICLAASRACGMRESVGTTNKTIQVGNASKSGVEVALLAAKGADAAVSAFEGKVGFLSLYGGDRDALHRATLDFAGGLELVVPGLFHKLYPCSGDIHSSLDAVLGLQNEFDIRVNSVSHIVCRANSTAVTNPSFPNPKTVTQAKFSFQFCVAAALVRGKLGIAEFRDDVLKDEMVKRLMKRIDVVTLNEEGVEDSFCSPAEVEIVLKNGKSFHRRVQWMRGHPANPMTLHDATRKLEMAASNVLNEKQLVKLVKLIDEIDVLPNIRLLTRATVASLPH